MIDHGIIAFYNDDLVELKVEFKDEFNRLTEDGEEGLYTFLFSWYHEYTVTTEIVFCMIFENTALFFVTPYAVQLSLDNNLMVTGGDVTPSGERFEKMFAEGEKSNVIHIGECCNARGYAYGIYAFGYDRALKSAVDIIENENYNANLLTIDDQDLIDVSMDFLEYRIEQYQEQVDRSFELEEPIAGLDENPYANEFYDDDGRGRIRRGPLQQARKLGDSNV